VNTLEEQRFGDGGAMIFDFFGSSPTLQYRFPWSFPWCAYFLCYIILVNGLLPLSPTFGQGRQTGNGKNSVPP